MEWLNYHHFYYFWRIARAGGLSKAAAELRISPSTLSGQLAALEQSLGATLFERRGRALALTPVGETIASYGDDIFRLGAEVIDVARGQPEQKLRPVRIGIVGSLPRTLQYRLLQPILSSDGPRKLPVPVAIRQDNLERLLGELTTARLHVVITDGPPAELTAQRVYCHPLGQSELLFYAVPKLAQRLRRGFPASLHGEPMLLPAPGCHLRRQLDRWLAEQQIRPQIAGEFDDAGLMRTFGAKGHGVFPVRAAMRTEVEEHLGVKLLGPISGAAEKYYALTTERRIRHPAISRLVAAARSNLAESKSAGRRRASAL